MEGENEVFIHEIRAFVISFVVKILKT